MISFLFLLYVGGAISRFCYETELDNVFDEEDIEPVEEPYFVIMPDDTLQNIVSALTWPISIYRAYK